MITRRENIIEKERKLENKVNKGFKENKGRRRISAELLYAHKL